MTEVEERKMVEKKKAYLVTERVPLKIVYQRRPESREYDGLGTQMKNKGTNYDKIKRIRKRIIGESG
jgi:hypothetical protein